MSPVPPFPPPDVNIQLAVANTRIDELTKAQTDLQARATALQTQTTQLQTQTTQLQQQLQDAKASAASAATLSQTLQSRLDQTTKDLTTAQQTLAQNQTDLGRLKAVADSADALRTDRDAVRQQLTQLQGTFDQRVADAVNHAVTQLTQQQSAASAQWAQERDGLKAQIADLQQRVGGPITTTRTTPLSLATQFAQVLSALAEGQSAAGAQTAAALTSLEVEARGVIEAPKQGETEPGFVTAQAGSQMQTEQLSTVRMSFKLLPKPPTSGT